MSREGQVEAVSAYGAAVDSLAVSLYEIPTDQPEADGTISWSTTTMVLVEATGGGVTGVGYSYAGAKPVIDGPLAPTGGVLCPDQGRPGFGLVFKQADAEQFRVA